MARIGGHAALLQRRQKLAEIFSWRLQRFERLELVEGLELLKPAIAFCLEHGPISAISSKFLRRNQ
jgi:hypothetical protein